MTTSRDDEVAELYRAPLSDFIDARNALAARLRKAGDAETAARVKALPKPSAPAWALNQVYWHARADHDRLIAAGDRLRSLQQQMLGGRSVDPRESMQERQAAVRQVVDRAAGFLADAGQAVTDATRQRINVTADALATWGSHPQGYVPGRLVHDIDPPGFAALASLGSSSLRLVKPSSVPAEAPVSSRKPQPAPQLARKPTTGPAPTETAAARGAAAKAAEEAARAREAERKRLERALQEAERDARSLAAGRDRTAGARSRATADAADLTRQVAALEHQLTALRAQLDRAERARADADTAAAKATAAHADAERTAARLRQELAQLEKG